MDANDLYNEQESAKHTLVKQLLRYVKEHGHDITEKERADFELFDEDGYRFTKILNFYELDGCVDISQTMKNPDIKIFGLSFDEISEQLDENFTYNVIQCLYVEIDDTGEENLKYYCFFNAGVNFCESADPDHDYVDAMGLSGLETIISNIHYYENKGAF